MGREGGFEISDVPGREEGGWFVKIRTSENCRKKLNSKFSQLKLEVIMYCWRQQRSLIKNRS